MEQRGFTLLEVLMALALLTGVLLVVAHLLVIAARAADSSRDATVATGLAAQKLEQLRALARGVASGGTDVDDLQGDVAAWPGQPTGGTGLTPSPPGTLFVDTAGFVDYLDVTGQWVGSGGSPPAAAAFARRWSIDPANPAAPTCLVLRVGVWRRPRAWSLVLPAPATWQPLIQLETAKARRGE
jgi:prepilin-type N-terminal cleavage/methylation domain-containing protein